MVDLFLQEITAEKVIYKYVSVLRELRYDRDGAMDWLAAPRMRR